MTRKTAPAPEQVRLTNPAKVLYPETGTTKREVLDYYLAVAGAILPGLAGRPTTRKRWPHGVEQASFFTKELDSGTPDWVSRVRIEHAEGSHTYPLIDSAAALAWCAQLGALELHVPQWKVGLDDEGAVASEPLADRIVFDLDPGPGVGLAECAEVAFAVKSRLGELGDRTVPVTSGSKGLHLYVPMEEPIHPQDASSWARLVAEQIAGQLPKLVVFRMTKAVRDGRVFFDWSQNNAKKTTITPYSLRGRAEPTVAAPRTWEEIGENRLRHLRFEEVLDRLSDGFDPFAGFGISTGTETPAASGRAAAPAHLSDTEHLSDRAGSSRGKGTPGRTTLAPMLATAGTLESLTPGYRWRLEGKWDGMRALAVVDGDTVRIRSRTGNDITGAYPEIAETLPKLLAGKTALLDGEIVAFDATGGTSFTRLQQRIGLTRPADVERGRRDAPVTYLVFDVLDLEGQSLLAVPFDERRKILLELGIEGERCLVPELLTGDPATVLEASERDGWEGLVAKRADSHYQPGRRSPWWIKLKNQQYAEVVIVGWQPGQGRRSDTLGSLLLAVPDGNGLRYCGKVGTGFTDKMLLRLRAVLQPLETKPAPAAVPRNIGRDMHWVEPTLVAEVGFADITQDGILRMSRWRGLRPDKTVGDLAADR